MKKSVSVAHQVASEHSRKNVQSVIRLVANDQKKFDELMRVFLGNDEELARRAAWSLSYVVEQEQQLIRKWFPKVIQNLNKANQHQAIYRNTFRFLQVIDIPDKFAVPVLDAAYKFVLNAGNDAAVRAFALSTAFNVVRKYPELAQELRVVAEQVIREESKAMISRGKRTLRDLDKLISTKKK